MTPLEATIEPDLYTAISTLFLRLLQRDQSERVGFVVSRGVGSTWIACAYVGETPPDIAKHYARSAVAAERESPAEQGLDAMSRVGKGPTAERALAEIKAKLLDALALRIKGDLGVYELATGRPFPGCASQQTPVDPHARPEDEGATRKPAHPRLGPGRA